MACDGTHGAKQVLFYRRHVTAGLAGCHVTTLKQVLCMVCIALVLHF